MPKMFDNGGELSKVSFVATEQGTTSKMKARYLIQFELDGTWVTCATRSTFTAAKSKAKTERDAMKGARETSIILEGDPECLRYMTSENFQLA